MSLLHEIIRCFCVAFGAFEFFINLSYLFRSDGILLSRRQHGELPATVNDTQMKRKVFCMMVSGFLFLCTGCTAFFLPTYPHSLFLLASSLFAMYSFIEAVYYRYWKTFGFFLVSFLFFLLVLLG